MSLVIDGITINNRLFLGTALYPSLEIMKESILASRAQVITIAIRRQLGAKKNSFWDYIKTLDCYLLPNTAGCFNAQEAIYTAQAAREIFETHWVKLEVIGDHHTCQPHPFELLKATEELLRLGFYVLPYCTDDLILCEHLIALGVEVLMPWGAPIGSGKGLINPYALKLLRARFANILIIIDAGIGCPSHAVAAMELGFDAILLNSAVALAHEPIKMAQAFSMSIESGRLAFEAGLMHPREQAQASTPLMGKPFTMDLS